MAAHLHGALSFIAPAAVLFVTGFIVQVHGPEGLVHGVLDWSRLSDPDKRAAGRFTGLVLYAMSLVLLGRAILACCLRPQIIATRGPDLAVPAILFALAGFLVVGLLTYRKRYRDRTKGPHER